MHFFNLLNLSAALGPGVHSASNRNEYQKQERARPLHRADNLLPSVSRFSRQSGILNIIQPCRPPRPVTGIVLLLFFTLLCSIFSRIPDDG
jgi:hypothetical protein